MNDKNQAIFDSFMKNLTPEKGYYDVLIHGPMFGESEGVLVMTSSGEKMLKGHRSLAQMIEGLSDYEGQNIRLLSCNNGSLPDGLSQNLANKLGVDVLGADNYVWAYSDGSFTVGPGKINSEGKLVPVTDQQKTTLNLFTPGKK